MTSSRPAVDLIDLTCRSRPYDMQLLQALRSRKWEARLWLAGCSDSSNSSGHIVDIARKLPSGRVQKASKAAEYLINLGILYFHLRRRPPEVLHLQWLPMLELIPFFELQLLRQVRRQRVGVVYTVHNVLPHGTGQRHRSAFRRAYHSADALICHTQTAREELVSEFHVPEKRIWTIPHGPLMSDIAELPRAKCRSEFGLGKDELQVLLFGVLRPYKGIEFLLRSWKRVEEAGANGNARLVLAGSGQAGYLKQIDDVIRELGLEDRVETIYEFIPESKLRRLIQASDVLVYPYREVTQSGALLAGMAAGKAIIATDLGGFREVLREGETALLAQYGDEVGFAERLERLLRDSGLRRRLGTAVQKEVHRRYSWSSIAERTIECYTSLES